MQGERVVSIVDLKTRITPDFNAYMEFCHSSDSLIYVEECGDLNVEAGEPSLDLCVGESWFDCRASGLSQ